MKNEQIGNTWRVCLASVCIVLTILLCAPGSAGAQQTGAKQSAGTKQRTKRQAQPRQKKVNPVMAPITDVPGLPRVLLIGDSISIGYTLPVRAALQGKANVHRPPANCGPTTTGLQQLDQWLGDKKWDLIHFNWGLHDLKYMGPNGGNLADPKAASSHQQVPPAEYEKNLRKLVSRLQKTGAILIWRNTTPVPPGAKGRVVGDSVKYNAIAAKVMTEAGIETDDLYSLAKSHMDKIMRKANVHFTPEGYQMLAKEAANVILKHLDQK